MGFVYLLHFDKPYKHAQHYIGYAENNVEDRIETHRKGNGARLISVIIEAGITFTLAKVWDNVDRHFERKLKNRNGASKICPLCKEIHNGSTNRRTKSHSAEKAFENSCSDSKA